MSAEARYSITIKIAGDLFTVRGDSQEEFAANVAAATNLIGAVRALQHDATAEFEVALAKKAVAYEVPLDQPAPAPTKEIDGDLFAAPTTPYDCQHGRRVFKEGQNKQGKPYQGWFCSHPILSEACQVKWGK